MKYASLHKQSTLLREYPPNGISKPWIIQACLRHPYTPALRKVWSRYTRFELAISCHEWDTCSSYPESTRETRLDEVPLHHLAMVVFEVLPALAKTKSWRALSSICKYLRQNPRCPPF